MGKQRKIGRHGWDDNEYEIVYEIVHDLASCCTGFLFILAMWSFHGWRKESGDTKKQQNWMGIGVMGQG